MDLLPSTGPHWHVVLNHFPSIGTIIAVGLLLSSFYLKSEDLRRASLVMFLLMALLAIPTYVSGAAARWSLEGTAASMDAISAHQDSALLTLATLGLTGCLSWLALWQWRRFSRPANWNLFAITVLSIITVGLLVQTGNRAGYIHAERGLHPGEQLAVAEGIGRTEAVQEAVLTSPWVWPALEAAHFIGMALLFGVVLLVALRALGLAKNLPFSAVHRVLPLGVAGLVTNVVTGFLFFIADSGRYVAMVLGFPQKMALIVIGGIAVLYFTIFENAWSLKSGDDAPVSAKVMAVATILLWTGVIVYGRLLPYVEGG